MSTESKAAQQTVAGAVFSKDFLIEHWKANWKLACEDYMELQAVNKELLEALEITLESHGACDGRGCFCAVVRAAIAKARGTK